MADKETERRIRTWKGKSDLRWMRKLDEAVMRDVGKCGIRVNTTNRNLCIILQERAERKRKEAGKEREKAQVREAKLQKELWDRFEEKVNPK